MPSINDTLDRESATHREEMSKPVLAVIGSGWGGFQLSQKVSLAKYHIKVISPTRTVQYTPLLASAACGLFNFRLAEEPIRRKSRTEMDYYKAIAEDVDFDKRVIKCRTDAEIGGEGPSDFEVKYDKLCIAPGCAIQDFGTPGAKDHAFFLRTTDEARMIQQRILQMLDKATLPTASEQEQRDILSIRIVGGGAIGIEAAAELWDLWHEEMRFLFPQLDGKLSITIHDVAPTILTTFDERLSEYAVKSLKGKSVGIKTSSHIEKVDGEAIYTKEDGKLPYGLLIWATGNKANDLVEKLPVKRPEKGLPRILTDKYLRVLRPDGSPMEDVYALGDAADIDGESLPTLAEVALQKGEYLTEVLNGDGSHSKPFTYKQRALLAYLGRHDGIIGGRQDWTGASAWLAWRSGSLAWTRSWRRRLFIAISWLFIWLGGGRDIARP
ncbi:mitochondrial external NADH dehydrogenase protein [Colletotrichum truncatum]|uniref:Mitochondrial external NADH dehydrogenase protein n=1 Tax=Colletotrichum truncatum TaxID=5467 RepID=A0ACC3YWX2_COLTU|nr:mitochondrial external NADH dehydrogenase protein [Colletotrichum truncatum]KAF6781533.1 mitochondrial external NADH dehydrogenase protein [Colletotrichum truncatum]